MCGLINTNVLLIMKGEYTMEKLAILTDTGGAITPEEANKLGIYLLPLQIGVGEDNYEDLFEISINKVYDLIESGKMLNTSMPSYIKIEEMIKQIKDEGYTSIIAIPLTSGISSTASVIESTAHALEMPIDIIDCYTPCRIQKMMTYKAVELVEKGLSRKEIVDTLRNMIKYSNSILMPSDMDHLKRGGRLTPMAATLASMLKIVPLLQLNPSTLGKIDTYDKVRTKKKAYAKAAEEAMKLYKEDSQLFVLHTRDLEGAKLAKDELIKLGANPKNIIIDDINAIIAVHTGMQAIAIQIVRGE